jgi:hypothetical protein
MDYGTADLLFFFAGFMDASSTWGFRRVNPSRSRSPVDARELIWSIGRNQTLRIDQEVRDFRRLHGTRSVEEKKNRTKWYGENNLVEGYIGPKKVQKKVLGRNQTMEPLRLLLLGIDYADSPTLLGLKY